ncbi:MAG: cytochrome c [Deltaproteobacteria bacterium]|nr:cytochrome c [Deltaproteobacteria bacterium]
MIRRLFLGFVLLSLPVAAYAAGPERALGSLKNGEAVFNVNCAKCHGLKGSGTDKGPPLVRKIYEPNHHSDLSFYWAVERGVRSHHWSYGDMPRIEGVSKADTGDIIAYIRALQKEAGIY